MDIDIDIDVNVDVGSYLDVIADNPETSSLVESLQELAQPWRARVSFKGDIDVDIDVDVDIGSYLESQWPMIVGFQRMLGCFMV